MLFTSSEFLFVFLPLVLTIFFTFARRSKALALTWLSASSLFFYGWSNPGYVCLLIASIAFNYIIGYGMQMTRKRGINSSMLMVVGVTADLCLLGFYKYLFFFSTAVNSLLDTSFSLPNFILPLGISFFTFTQIAFLVDVHRGQVVDLNFGKYFLFVTYFPHLIAGPIIHHKGMMHQFGKPSIFKANWNNFVIGLTLFSIGLAKKLILADTFANFSAPGFLTASLGDVPSAAITWVSVISYTFQIYFDFSGYSDMAVGISRLLGIQLPVNFRSPYKSINIIEFWRRWHMTLSEFLRDYLYISLGGNRLGSSRRYINLILTMMLGGLWHGANSTFLVWGTLNGAYLCINHGWHQISTKFLISKKVPSTAGRFVSVSLTFTAVAIAWIFFRADTIGSALLMFQGFFSNSGFDQWHLTFSATQSIQLGILLVMTLLIVWGLPSPYDWLSAESEGVMMPPARVLEINQKYSLALPIGICILMLASLCAKFGPASISPFLYFQF